MNGQQAKGNTHDDYLVKGSTIRSKFDFVREQHGLDAERLFRGPFEMGGTILDSAWYPFELFDKINEELAQQFLGGDERRLEEVGRFSASTAFLGVYKSFLTASSFDRFLQRIASLHDLMYSAGRMEVEPDIEHKACCIRQVGAPVYTSRDLYVAQGFYTRAAELFHLRGVRCTFREMPEGAVFDLTWQGSD